MTENEDLILRARMILGGVFPCTADLQLRHYMLDRYITPATGFVTAQIAAEGALAQLKDASGTVQIDTIKLLVEGQSLENVGAIIAVLKDRVILLQSCELVIAGQNLYANGSMPLEFASGTMDITASSGEIQLADIAYLLPRDPAISGLLRFDLRVQNAPRSLDVDGMLSLTDGGYKAKNLVVDSVNSLLRFKNGLVTTNRLTGKVNKGRFEIVGFADISRGLLDTMLLDISMDRIDYANKDFGYAVCSADLQAGARKDSLRISGEVIIDEAVYTAPMNLQTYIRLLTNVNRPAPQQPEISKRIYCDIGITVPDSIVIANNVANLAVKADLQLKGYLARINAYGTIAAMDDGTIQYLGKKFTIVNAVIQFDDPYKIDPVIDLTAISTIAASDGEYEIYLRLEGTTTNWQLGLNSNPPLPEQDIVSLLLIGQRRPGAVSGMAKETDLKGKVRDYALD
jgi:translocation and assembly module TamB